MRDARELTANLKKQTGLGTLRVDANYVPVPVSRDAATQMMAMSPTPDKIGPMAFVVRGTIDDSEINKAKDPVDSKGNARIFADPRIGLFPNSTCGGDPLVGDTVEVRKLLGVGRLRNLGMDGSRTAVAVVDNGINLDALRNKGLHPTLDTASSWSPRVAIQPGAAPLDHRYDVRL
jgi:hypothetical protein